MSEHNKGIYLIEGLIEMASPSRAAAALTAVLAVSSASRAAAAAAEEEPQMRQLYSVRPAHVRYGAGATHAQSVLDRVWTALGAPLQTETAAIAATALRPRGPAHTTALLEVGNFEDPAYCPDGVAVKIISFAGVENKDWFSKSDPYATVAAKDNAGAAIKSKKGKDKPKTETIQNTLDKKHWNQFFCFPSPAVQATKVELWDKDSWTSDDLMGYVDVRREQMEGATAKGGKPFPLSSKGTITLRFKMPAAPAPAVTEQQEKDLEKAAADDAAAEAARLAKLAEETRLAAEAEQEAARKAELEKEAQEKAAAAEAQKAKAETAKANWGKLSGGVDAAVALNGAADDAAAKAKAEKDAAEAEAARLAQEAEDARLAAEAEQEAARKAELEKEAADKKAAAEAQEAKAEAARAAWGKLSGGVDAAAALNGAADDAAAKAKSGKYCANRCEAKRVRKDWALMSVAERATYIKAVKALYDGGVYSTFVRVHQNGINDPYAHGTSAFLPWHRKYLLELEDALRCLGEEFECVTLPYWDWAEWQYFCNKQPGGCPSYDHVPPNMAAEMAKDRPVDEQKPELVTSILQDFGGPGTKKAGCLAPDCLWGSAGSGDPNDVVGCVQAGPFSGWEDWDGHCLSRGIDWGLPAKTPGIRNRPFTTNSFLLSILLDNEHYGSSYSDGYRGALQNEPHNNQHNYLGGHMRSMRSPMDPIFFTHHAMVDKQWARWQDCHNYQRLSKDEMGEDQYQGNAGRTDKKVGFDDSIDVDMPYFLADENPFTPNPAECGEAAMGGGGECTQCLADSFRNLKKVWCVTKWHPSCFEYCERDQCREKCGSGGGHRALKQDDFKLKGYDNYEYMWDNNKLGSRPRDWIQATDKYGDSTYHYQLDAFDRLIGESACEMIWETSPAGSSAAATSFLEKLASLDSMKGQDFKAKVEANLQSGGNMKEAVKTAAKSELKNQCGLQAKSPMCASLPASQGCAFVCPDDITQLGDENANDACIFNALFGAPASSDNLKWSSTCKAEYQTDDDYAASGSGSA